MKKILALTLCFMMLVPSLGFADYYDEEIVYSDIFNNPILEIVAQRSTMPSQPSPDAVVIEKGVYSDYDSENDCYKFIEEVRYSDGTFTEKHLFSEKDYEIEKATKYFPAYLEDGEGYYVYYETTDERSQQGYFSDIYLIDTTKEELSKKKIASLETVFEDETSYILYVPYKIEEVNGQETRVPLVEKPLSYYEFYGFKKGSQYNDGMKLGKLDPSGEYGYMTVLSDINNNVYFEDPEASYFNYFYNLGYLVTSSNNGYALDYELEDPETMRVYITNIENVFTKENYTFYDTDIWHITDSGYVNVDVKDEARVETKYLAKIKKSALIKVMIDGEKVLFDVLPTITDGRTLVPLRAIFESLNAKVLWNGDTKTVTATKGDREISLTIGSNVMKVNGEDKVLDVPATITDGRTLVPVRAISEAFGCEVDWNGDDRAVIIKTK